MVVVSTSSRSLEISSRPCLFVLRLLRQENLATPLIRTVSTIRITRILPLSLAAVAALSLGLGTMSQASAATSVPTPESSLSQGQLKSKSSCDKLYKSLSKGCRFIPAPPARAACWAAAAASYAACLAAD